MAFKTDTTIITLVSVDRHLTTQHRYKNIRDNSIEIIARNILMCKARSNRNLLNFLWIMCFDKILRDTLNSVNYWVLSVIEHRLI